MCLAPRSVLCGQEKGTGFISRNAPSKGGGSRHTGIRGAVRGRALDVQSLCYLQCILKIYNSTTEKQPSFKVGKDPSRQVSKDMHVAHDTWTDVSGQSSGRRTSRPQGNHATPTSAAGVEGRQEQVLVRTWRGWARSPAGGSAAAEGGTRPSPPHPGLCLRPQTAHPRKILARGHSPPRVPRRMNR